MKRVRPSLSTSPMDSMSRLGDWYAIRDLSAAFDLV
jgi:hypothetical protein